MNQQFIFKKQSFLLFCLFALCLGMFSCSKDKDDPDPEPEPELCETLDVKYSTDIVPIMTATCAIEGCHVAGFATGDYTMYEEIKQRIDGGAFETRVVEQKNMPPANTTGPTELTDDQLDQIKCWLADGAPDN